ncbi:hypothetical protein [Plasmodium yoelii yoelii]|uniref:Uncharacterized protein n=1 Tax=Plasmodium yoelii yoelii TaxID=73239 RepID=Q7RLM7_PLAYO|nr:hypothetical protein [Plasmodium yoelii yoelii]
MLKYITNNKDEIIKNYNDIQPSNKETVLLNYLGELKKKVSHIPQKLHIYSTYAY